MAADHSTKVGLLTKNKQFIIFFCGVKELAFLIFKFLKEENLFNVSKSFLN